MRATAGNATHGRTPFGRLGNAVWAVATLGAATAFFARFFQFSSSLPWTFGIGDWIDPYYVNVVLENWYHDVVSLGGSLTPPMYFPVEAARYSHGFVLYAPIYVVTRLFTHPFTADTITIAVVMIGGSWCLYLLFRRMGLTAIEAFVVSACCCTSPNLVNPATVVWAQRASVFLIPPILLVLTIAMEVVERRRRLGLLLGGLAGLSGGLFLAQDFYTAALLGLLAGLVGVTFAVKLPGHVAMARERVGAIVALARRVPRARRPSLLWLALAALSGLAALAIFIHPFERRSIAGWAFSANNPGRVLNIARVALFWYGARWTMQLLALVQREAPGGVRGAAAARFDGWRPERRRLGIAVAAGALLGVLVFLSIYLKPYLEFPTFPRGMILDVLHQPPSPFSDGLATTLRWAQPFESVRPFEVVLGMVLIMWVFPRAVDRRTRLHGIAFVFVSLLVILMPLRFGDWSPWMILFSWLPGMSAVRDPKRMIYIYELAVTLVAAMWLTSMPRRSVARWSAVLLVAGITVSDWQTSVVPYLRDNRVFDQWVRAPIRIDPSCRNFFMKGASAGYMSRSGHMWSLYAVDASFISLEHSIPTLNGYSAWMPVDWGLANPQGRGYSDLVDLWIQKYDLQGTCALDIDARTMTPYTGRH